MWKPIALRPHVKPSEQVMLLIAPSHCWHFDAWFLRDSANRLYVRMETRAGGRELLTSFEYMYENGRLRMVPLTPADARLITMSDRAELANAGELNHVHTKYVLAFAARVPRGFRSRSVALHYVRAPDLPPITPDMENWAQL